MNEPKLLHFNSLKHNNGFLKIITKQCWPTWRRSIRSVGGYWIGTCDYTDSRDGILDLFISGLGQEIREQVGGILTWQGFLGEMELTLDGVTYTRSLATVINALRVKYTYISDNLLADGSAESAAWPALNVATTGSTTAQSTAWVTDGIYSTLITLGRTNLCTNPDVETVAWADVATPTTNERSTAWAHTGSYSEHIIADAQYDGALCQASAAISALTQYTIEIDLNIISGTWKLVLYRIDTGAELTSATSSGTGVMQLRGILAADNAFAGNAAFKIECSNAGECYADNAWLATTTNWGGAAIEQIAINDLTGYDFEAALKVVHGLWRAAIVRTDTWAILAQSSPIGEGDGVATCSLDTTNAYAGTVEIRVMSDSADGSCYGDGATFRTSPIAAQTGWYNDTNSQSEYGVIQMIYSEGQMTNDAANNLAQTRLRQCAWPKTSVPESFTAGKAPGSDKLSLTWLGYVHTLRYLYSTVAGTKAADAWPTALIALAEFVALGTVGVNAMTYRVDNAEPINLWEILSNMTLAGDASGNRWVCSVNEGRLFSYQQASQDIIGRYRNGKVYQPAGGEWEPWLAQPGLYTIDNSPTGPTYISTSAEDDPRNVWIEQVEMLSGGGLQFTRVAT